MQRSIAWRRIVRIATTVGKPENGGVHSRRLVLHHILRLTFSDNWKTVRSALTLANTIGAVRVLMEWGKVEREHAVASYDSAWKVFSPDGNIPQEGLRMVVEQAKAELKLTRDIPMNEIVDLAPLRAAQKELGIRK